MPVRIVSLVAALLLIATAPVSAECEREASRPEHDRCGQRYLERYESNPSDPSGDEALYNAGVSFEQAGSADAALSAYALLRRRFASSKLASKALARTAKLYGDIAAYDKAAVHLEEYAKRYAGEKDAYHALSDAVYYRTALGHHVKAVELTRYFIKTFGAKKPREAANAAFSLTAIYEKQGDPDAASKHLRDYIRTFGNKGGDDRLVIAYAKIGQILWDRSCPVKQVDGSCVKAVRPRSTGCEATMALVKRDRRTLAESLASFASAVKVFERTNGRTGGDEGGARYFYALAKLAEANVDHESSLELISDASRRTTAIDRYQRVIAINDAASTLMAMARLGQIELALADDAIATAKGPTRACNNLTAAPEPLQAAAIRSFEACSQRAIELSFSNGGSVICARQLTRLAPERHPSARELLADPVAAPVIATESPLGFGGNRP